MTYLLMQINYFATIAQTNIWDLNNEQTNGIKYGYL